MTITVEQCALQPIGLAVKRSTVWCGEIYHDFRRKATWCGEIVDCDSKLSLIRNNVPLQGGVLRINTVLYQQVIDKPGVTQPSSNQGKLRLGSPGLGFRQVASLPYHGVVDLETGG